MNRFTVFQSFITSKRTLLFKAILMLLILSGGNAIFAQNNIELSGQVKGDKTGEKLIYCSVAVLNMSDSLITGGITNETGYFSIPVNRGRYKLAFSYMGFLPDTITTGYVSANKFLGIYKLKEDMQSLDEVNITAGSRESTIDKDIQIVTDKMRKGAADAKEVLEKIPGLSYDRYNNTISVDNSGNVVFLVEGVEKNQEYIKNLSPDRLKKVEVIRNPGGRYGLEGYSAIINIILRKDYVGQELFINNQLLVDADQKNSNYVLPINNLNVTYNYSFNKLNIYAGFSNYFNKFALKTYNETNYNNKRRITEQSPDNDPNMFINSVVNNYTLGADYYINPRNTLSFETNISNFPASNQQIDQTFKSNFYDLGELIASYEYKTSLNKKSNDAYNTLFYVGKLSNKDRIDASFSYIHYHEKYDNKTTYDNLSWRNEQGINEKNYTKLNIEYNHTFNQKLSMQVGYDNIFKKLDNRFDVAGSDTPKDTSVVFKQTETRHNLYAYGSYSFNKKLSMKAGLAAEYSNPVTEVQNHQYFIYQPYFDLKYTISKIVSLKLMYRSDSDYPSISQTNPFSSQLNPTTITTGNPDLKPAVINKLSVKISVMQGLFSVEPYYQYSDNYISQTGFLRPDGMFEYSYSNIGHYADKGIQANFTIPIGKLFIWQNSFRFYSSKITYNNNVNSINDWKANSQLVFRGLKNNGVIVLNYRRDMSKNINALGYSRNNNDYWLFLVQQPLLKNRLTAMIGYMLPVNVGVNYDQGSYAKANGYEKYTHTDISVLKNMFIIRLSFRFNKGKVKKTNKHIDTEKEDSGNSIF